MNENEKQMTREESLSIISSMINNAKNRYSETGTLYLLWGFVIFICCITQFVMLYFFNNQNAYYVWYTTWVVAIYQFYYLFKKRKKEKVKRIPMKLLALCGLHLLYIHFGVYTY
jgi:O-antigen/teichoic acid export membrane protein